MNNEQTTLTHLDGSPIRVMVVEDDPLLNELLTMAMRAEGWETHSATHGNDALALVRDASPDVVIMDIMIPGSDGVEVVRRLRARGDDVPVLFLTAKDELQNKLEGLSAGGDDYVTKPFSLEEVVLRLRAMARRRVISIVEAEDTRLVVGDLVLDPQTHEVTRAGKAQILERVWDYNFDGNANVVEIYVSYLRKKIDALGPEMIHTLRGVGYSIRPGDEEAADG